MPGIDGIVSGLDTTGIINDVINSMRRPIVAMEISKETLEAKRAGYRELNTLLGNLETALGELDSPGEFGSFSTTSSASSAVTATAGEGAVAGSYSLEVVRLAEGSLDASSGFTARTDVIGDGTLDITIGGTVTSITVDAASLNNTPDLLADHINENVDGAFAYVVDTGVAGPNQFRLMVGAESTGVANAVGLSFAQTGTGAALSFTNSIAAVDAEITFGGLTINKSENLVSDVVPGVTLELLNPTTGPARITVGSDPDTMADNVDTFVEAYNEVVDFLSSQRTSSEDEAAGALSGDSTLRTIERRLANVLSGGFATGQISGLNELGIGTGQDGKISFDRSAFETSLNDHFSDVMTALAGTNGLFTSMGTVADQVTDPTTGLIEPRIDGLDTEIEDIEERITRQEERLDLEEERLRSQFATLELIMSEYQSTETFLNQQIEQWNSNK